MKENQTVSAGTLPIKKGDTVRSIANKVMTYRVLSIGPKRARLSAIGIGYYTAYCPVELLEKAEVQ